VSDSGRKTHVARPGCEAVSAVKLSQQLTAEIDAWAEVHAIARSDAIRQLIELGLSVARGGLPHVQIKSDARHIEQRAICQLRNLLDPSLPIEERERRVRRLIEGPPEFAECRIDLPKQGG
jgi:hypothetical protein